jgi:hypothetical protein
MEDTEMSKSQLLVSNSHNFVGKREQEGREEGRRRGRKREQLL